VVTPILWIHIISLVEPEYQAIYVFFEFAVEKLNEFGLGEFKHPIVGRMNPENGVRLREG